MNQATSNQPYLTSNIPGIGGKTRVLPEDFQVEERPLYLPSGKGEHLYVKITKRLLSTPDLVRKLSSMLGIKVQAIGTAGFKDARAVTSQMVSMHFVEPEQLSRHKTDDHLLSVEVLGRHRNRLRPGHHAGNRFQLVIRNVAAHAKETVPVTMEVLGRHGVPNYFGLQRQGRRGDNFRIGEALLSDAAKRAKLSRAQRMWYLNS